MSTTLNQYIISGLASSANINVAEGKRLVITEESYVEPPVKTRKPVPHYDPVGSGMKTRYFTSYPYEETLLDLTKPEAWLFKLMLRGWDRDTGYTTLDLSHLPKVEQNKASEAYKKLHGRDLVRRVRKQLYLINPYAKIHLDLFSELDKVWEALGKPKLGKQPKSYQFISWLPEHFWLKSYKTWNAKTKSYLSK